MSIWKYYKWLPSIADRYRFTRGEGLTPLIRSSVIGKRLGLNNLFFKLENLNPTGSYKDRFAAVTVSRLLQLKQKMCIATSSGNTGAALAAYCASAGIRCLVMAVEGAPRDKLLQMQAYGAWVYEISGFGLDPAITEEVFTALRNFALEADMPLPVSAYSFYAEGMQGVETIACEILEDLDAHHIFSPAGGGGLTLAVARGTHKFLLESQMSFNTKVHCVQPSGNNTIAGNLRNNETIASKISASTTSISGLQVPDVLDGNEVIQACRNSGGTGFVVEDNDVYRWQSELAKSEGIFCEPAGAVALTGVVSALEEGSIDPDENIVCLVTGSGFKNLKVVLEKFPLIPVKTSTIKNMNNVLYAQNIQIRS